MSGFCGGEQDACFEKKQHNDCGCGCVEDPSIRSLRKLLCRREGNVVTIITDNTFSIVTGTVDRVTCGTVELTGATFFFTPGTTLGRVIIALSKINDVIPVTDTVTGVALMDGLRALRV